MAHRQGLELQKSHRRDPRAIDADTYQLVNRVTGKLHSARLPTGFGLSLQDVERLLTTDAAPIRPPAPPPDRRLSGSAR